mmetsp:Transcript_52711/g.78732  ORF Transcript_52711/g.78732 Transcript_52711/m.78732 type:complete len:228 (-) Transcript_52711:2923-3606(-)
MVRLVLLSALLAPVAGFAGMNEISRRQALQQASAGLVGAFLVGGPIAVAPAFADEEQATAPAFVANLDEETPKVTTRMGGLLERYQDSNRGWQILAPSGWNKFEGEVGAYDVKWQDLVDPKENVKVSSTPVKSAVSRIDVLGDFNKLGEGLASKRNAKLVTAAARLTDDILFYTFEFAINDGTHQILVLCVNKGRIWSLDLNSTEKRWSKQKELYTNIAGSFMPKLA